MATHTHRFVETYSGLVGFGLDRETDENAVMYYLQKFSDDTLLQTLVKRLSDEDLAAVFNLVNRLLKENLSEAEYHRLFLKNEHE